MDAQIAPEPVAPHVVCKYCRSTAVRKYGHYHDTQLYFCNSCHRKFVPNDALFHMKKSAAQVSSALNLYYGGSSINAIRKQLKQECGAAPTAKTRITPKMPRITQRAGRLA